jgi:hypothetical protein
MPIFNHGFEGDIKWIRYASPPWEGVWEHHVPLVIRSLRLGGSFVFLNVGPSILFLGFLALVFFGCFG